MMLATIDNNPWHALTFGLLLLGISPLILKFFPKLQENSRGIFRGREHPSLDEFQRIGSALFVGLSGLLLVVSAIIRLS
jgi:hypothetical protein